MRKLWVSKERVLVNVGNKARNVLFLPNGGLGNIFEFFLFAQIIMQRLTRRVH